MRARGNCFRAMAVLVLMQGTLRAQTVNTGELYVTKNTIFASVGSFDNTATATFINDGEAFIYNHFNNDGTVDYTPGEQGYTRFEGTAVQQLSGGNISYFYNVLFNNPTDNAPAFELSGEISINGQADFYNGIVNNQDYGGEVIFENNAAHINADHKSHVDGRVQKRGNTNFQYPVGDKQLFRYAAISAPEAEGDAFSAQYVFENPEANYPLANKAAVIEVIDDAEYWTITRDAGTSNVLITLSWDENSTTPQAIVAQPETAIHIVRWDEVRQMWVDEGGVADYAAKSITTVIAPNEYGVFTLARVKEELILPGNVVIYNALSPDGDGHNDYFLIDNIQDLDNNRVQVFNRWGAQVFETTNYDTAGNVFRGYSEGRWTVGADKQLSAGTYFYVLSYDVDLGGTIERVERAGYLYLNR